MARMQEHTQKGENLLNSKLHLAYLRLRSIAVKQP